MIRRLLALAAVLMASVQPNVAQERAPLSPLRQAEQVDRQAAAEWHRRERQYFAHGHAGIGGEEGERVICHSEFP